MKLETPKNSMRSALTAILVPLAVGAWKPADQPLSLAAADEKCFLTGDAVVENPPISLKTACYIDLGDGEYAVRQGDDVELQPDSNGNYPMPFDRESYVQVVNDQPALVYTRENGERVVGMMIRDEEEKNIYSYRRFIRELGVWKR